MLVVEKRTIKKLEKFQEPKKEVDYDPYADIANDEFNYQRAKTLPRQLIHSENKKSVEGKNVFFITTLKPKPY